MWADPRNSRQSYVQYVPDSVPEQEHNQNGSAKKKHHRWGLRFNSCKWRWPFLGRRGHVVRMPVWVQLTVITSLLGFLAILILVIIMAAKTWKYSTQLMEYRLSTSAALVALQTQNRLMENQAVVAEALDHGIINDLMYSIKKHNITAMQYQHLINQLEGAFISSSVIEGVVLYDLQYNTAYSYGRMVSGLQKQYNILEYAGNLLPLSNITRGPQFLNELSTNPSGIWMGPVALTHEGEVLKYAMSLTMGIEHMKSDYSGENIGYATVIIEAYQNDVGSAIVSLFPSSVVYVAEAVDNHHFKYITPLGNEQYIPTEMVAFDKFPAMYEAMLLSDESVLNHTTESDAEESPRRKAVFLTSTISTYKTVPAGAMMRTISPHDNKVSVGYSYAESLNRKWLFAITIPQSSSYKQVLHIRNVVIYVALGVFGAILILVVPLSRWQTAPLYRIYANMGFEPHGRKISSSSLPLEALDATLHVASHFLDSETGFTGHAFQIPARLQPLNRGWTDELDELVTEYNNMVDRLTNQYLYLEDEVRARTEEAQEARLLAEAANTAKSEFIANITHELRTPLNGIMGMTSVTVVENDINKIRSSLHTIIESGEVLVELINELLAFSKTQVGVEPVIHTFTVSELLSQLHDVFWARAEAQSVILTLAAVPTSLELVKLSGDSSRLHQVCVNVLSNAMKFSDEGGSINVIAHLRLESDKHISLMPYTRSGKSLGNRVVILEILISDSGVGMDPAQMARIFDLFVQGDSTLSKRYHGTGLGMSMSRLLTEGIGGYIAVFSAEGVGSTVAIRVPVGIYLGTFELQALEGPKIEFTVQDVNVTLSVEAGEVTKLSGQSEIPSSTIYSKLPMQPGSLMVPSQVNTSSSDATSSTQASRTFNKRPLFSMVPNLVSTKPTSSFKAISMTQPSEAQSLPCLRLSSNSATSLQSLVNHPGGFSNNGTTRTEYGSGLRSPDTTKVLVADDNLLNQQIMVRMLTRLGVPFVDTAKDGVAVVQMVERAIIDGIHYHIIFIDLSMPRMGGIEATTIIRGTLGYPYPVVALTGYSDPQTLQTCHDALIQDVLPKPVMTADIARILAKYDLE